MANEHLDGAMPTSVDSPEFAKLAEVATEAFGQDPSIQRRAATLAKSFKGLDPAEANRQALAEIFAKDYKLTPDMGSALMLKVLENY